MPTEVAIDEEEKGLLEQYVAECNKLESKRVNFVYFSTLDFRVDSPDIILLAVSFS